MTSLRVALLVVVLVSFTFAGIHWCWKGGYCEEITKIGSKRRERKSSEGFENTRQDGNTECAEDDIKCRWRKAEKERLAMQRRIRERLSGGPENEEDQRPDDRRSGGSVAIGTVEADAPADADMEEVDGDKTADKAQTVNEETGEEEEEEEEERGGGGRGAEETRAKDATAQCMSRRVRVLQGGQGTFSTTPGDAAALLGFLGAAAPPSFYVASAISRTRSDNTKERQNEFAFLNAERPVLTLSAAGDASDASNTSDAADSPNDLGVTIRYTPEDIRIPRASLLVVCRGARTTETEDGGEGQDAHPAYDPATLDRDFDMGNEMKSVHKWDESRGGVTGLREFGYAEGGREEPGVVDFDAAYGVAGRKSVRDTQVDPADEEGLDACMLERVRTFEGGPNYVTLYRGDVLKMRDLLKRHDTDFLVIAHAESKGNNTILTEDRKAALDALNGERPYFRLEEEEEEDDDDGDEGGGGDPGAIVRVDLYPRRKLLSSWTFAFPPSMLLDVCCTAGLKR